MKAIITTFTLIVVLSGISQSTQSEEDNIWVSINYLKCLDVELPCKCEDWSITQFLENKKDDTLIFNSSPIINFKKDLHLTFDIIDRSKYLDALNKSNNNISKSNFIKAHIKIKEDSLFYHDIKTNTIQEFIKTDYHRWHEYYEKKSLQFVNSLLEKNGHPNLTTILKSDKLRLECDMQLGINRIQSAKKTWVLEIRDNTIFLYRYRYPDLYSKKRRIPAKKRLIKKYQTDLISYIHKF